jgi:hypothetical protein
VRRLHAAEPVRGWAIAELYDRLRREAAFHIRLRVTNLPAFPRSDIDDLATQAAGDALVVLLRKLDEYRGDSQFWSWARRFAALEAPMSIRRRVGHDRVGISSHPELACDVADPGRSAHERHRRRGAPHDTGSDLQVAPRRSGQDPVGDGMSTAHSRRDAEVEDIGRALRGYGVLSRARLVEVCGAVHWPDTGFRQALAQAVASGRVRRLGADLYGTTEPES